MEHVREVIQEFLLRRGGVRAIWLARVLGISRQAAFKWIRKFVQLGELSIPVDGPAGFYRAPPSERPFRDPGAFWTRLAKAHPPLLYIEARRAGDRLVRKSQALLLYDPNDPFRERPPARQPTSDIEWPRMPRVGETDPTAMEALEGSGATRRSGPSRDFPRFAIVDFLGVRHASGAFLEQLFVRSYLDAVAINAQPQVVDMLKLTLGR